jgi:hypothetical protein
MRRIGPVVRGPDAGEHVERVAVGALVVLGGEVDDDALALEVGLDVDRLAALDPRPQEAEEPLAEVEVDAGPQRAQVARAGRPLDLGLQPGQVDGRGGVTTRVVDLGHGFAAGEAGRQTRDDDLDEQLARIGRVLRRIRDRRERGPEVPRRIGVLDAPPVGGAPRRRGLADLDAALAEDLVGDAHLVHELRQPLPGATSRLREPIGALHVTRGERRERLRRGPGPEHVDEVGSRQHGRLAVVRTADLDAKLVGRAGLRPAGQRVREVHRDAAAVGEVEPGDETRHGRSETRWRRQLSVERGFDCHAAKSSEPPDNRCQWYINGASIVHEGVRTSAAAPPT